MKNRNYFIVILLNIIILLASLMTADTGVLRVVSLLQLVANTYYFIKGNNKFLSVGLVFFWLLYLFHCSRFVFLEDNGFDMAPEPIVLLSFKFAICCLSSISVGYFLSRSKNKTIDVSNSEFILSDSDLYLLRSISKYIVILTLIPFLYVDITRLIHTMTFGYGELYHIGERDIIFKYSDPISHLFRPAVIILMISYYKKPKVATSILVSFCAYSLIMMLSGARITALVYILSIVVVYVRFIIKRVKVSQFVAITLLAVFVFTLLPVLSTMRRSGISQNDYRDATSVVDEAGGNFNVAINEFGGSQVSLIYAINFTHNFNYGKTYLASLLCISPKLPSSLDKTNLTYTNSFPESYQFSLGGSCIGEAYYNFGWFSIAFFIIVGLLVGRLDSLLFKVNSNNLLQCIICIVLIPGLLTWVRDFFMILVFNTFWIPLFYKIALGNRRTKRVY